MLTETPTVNVPTSTAILPDGEPFVIGHSVAGREIKVVRFGNGPIQRMIVADVHGGYEENTNRLVNYMIDYLKTYPDQIPPGITLNILKTLNPDGLARSLDKYGRLNDHGVDINRNFNSNWKAQWDSTGCWNLLPVSSGSMPESEPETQALVHFIETHSVDALISYHSAGLGIFAGGQPNDLVSERLARLLAGVSGYTYPPITNGCEFTGQMANWASSLGIAAVDVELSNHTDIDWVENRTILNTFLAWER
jgi:hypothetical protein